MKVKPTGMKLFVKHCYYTVIKLFCRTDVGKGKTRRATSKMTISLNRLYSNKKQLFIFEPVSNFSPECGLVYPDLYTTLSVQYSS